MIEPVARRWPIAPSQPGRYARATGHRVEEIAPGKWRLATWSRTHTFTPDAVYAPASLEQLLEVIAQCGRDGRRVKPAGALHSWSPGAVTSDVSLQMGLLDRVLSVDAERLTIRAEAGIRLRDLYSRMNEAGMALPCLPNVDTIQLGGAIANATHGTCIETDSMCSLVASLDLVVYRNGTAEVLTLRRHTRDPHERHLFEAAVASFGTLGAIYAVTLQCVPAFHAYVHDRNLPFEQVENRFEALARQHYSVRFMWYPVADLVNTKIQVPIRGPLVAARSRTLMTPVDVLTVRVVSFANERNPKTWRWLRRTINGWMSGRFRASRRALLERSKGALMSWSDAELESRMHAAFSKNPFVNLEYAVPLTRCDEAITALRALYRRYPAVTMSAVGLRPVGADDAGYLAAPKGQAVVYVDLPYVAELEATGLYAEVEQTLIALGGRCSWSRLIHASPEQFLVNYPEHHRFVDAKRELDPQNLFSNAFSDRICFHLAAPFQTAQT